MFPNPVAHFELVRAARRPRTYALRSLFGLVVLGVIAVDYVSLSDGARPWYDPGEVTVGELARFGQALFWAVMTTQTALVLGLTPALAADSIAAERQGKTLAYLLASPLSGFEVVAGKLVARLAHVVAFLALVLPVMGLVALFGGVPFAGLFLGDLALASTAFFLTSLSILASIGTPRPRDAVGSAYLLTGAWLFLPGAVQLLLGLLPDPGPALAAAARGVFGWVWPPSPLTFLTDAPALLGSGPEAVWARALWTVAAQSAYGALFLGLASWRLRPAFRRLESQAGSKRSRVGRRARVRERVRRAVRPCGDDPVYWKEAVLPRAPGGFRARLVRWGVPALLGGMAVFTLVQAEDAFGELLSYGYVPAGPGEYRKREAYNMLLRVFGTLLAGVWALWLAGRTAAGVTSEKEQDTWDGLLATPLDGLEILAGKARGALRATAGFGAALAALWLTGLASGAVHPLGLLAAALTLALTIWFALVLGTYASLTSRSTWRARAWAQGILLGPSLCCLLPIPSAFYLIGISLASYTDLKSLFDPRLGFNAPAYYYGGGYYLGGLVLYTTAAVLLTRWSFGSFDLRVGRPGRPRVTPHGGPAPPPPDRTPPA